MSTAAIPCRFFQQGQCRYGDACRFSHGSNSAAIPNTRPDPRSQIPCTFYQEGNCRAGTNCPYQHHPSDSRASTRVSSQHDKDNCVRVFYGALVRYGDGASVTSFSLCSEYSSVRLDGLPADTTPAGVIELLSGLGHDVEIDGLKIVAMPQSPLRSAYISTPDPGFCRNLNTILMNNPDNSLKAEPVHPRLPSWASTRRARCNHLKLKWTKPFGLECVVYFRSNQSAKNVSDKFKDGRLKVLGTRVNARLVGNSQTGVVWLTGLPLHCLPGTIWSSIGVGVDSPYHVSTPQLPVWEKDAVASIKSLISGVGHIDFMTEPSTRNGHCWTLSAHFKQDSDALAAMQIVELKAETLFHKVNLIAKPVYNSAFKVSKEIHHHVQHRIQAYLSRHYLPPLDVVEQQGYILLSLNGGSSKVVAERASAIEKIVAGDVIKGGNDTPFWVPQLESNGSASNLLREIQERHGVLLLPSRSKREVRCFGDLSKQTAVQEDSEVGDEIVSVNMTSNPKKLIVNGSDEEYSQVLALLRTSNIPFGAKETPSQEDCTLCVTRATDPITIGCGHTYCTECFKRLCRHTRTQEDIGIVCPGAENTCRNAISMKEIQAHADPVDFEQLLESSFKSYINRRPDQFHYCPTPDCTSIYRPARASASPSWHMCNQCLQLICRSCHKSHAGRSCSEHEACETFEIWKRENSDTVKDCPKCRTTMAKIDGCDHIQCGGCYTHLCWVCMATFEQAQLCSDHAQNAHRVLAVQWKVEKEYDDASNVNYKIRCRY
ncbi:hypothetical protein F4678DRAFT_480535 [Xylaria arbuscula]|nr:hypothetical protein F4678DRAFT_480535 [Xylaria arbuscula]